MHTLMQQFVFHLLSWVALCWVLPAQAGAVLQGVINNQVVRCGVSSGVVGFSAPNAEGVYQGLDVDVCRAVAAAVS